MTTQILLISSFILAVVGLFLNESKRMHRDFAMRLTYVTYIIAVLLIYFRGIDVVFVCISANVFFAGVIYRYIKADSIKAIYDVNQGEEILKMWLEYANDNGKGFLILNYDMTIESCNKNFANYLGYKQSELIGEKFNSRFITEEWMKKSLAAWEDGKDLGILKNYENKWIHKQGHEVPMYWTWCKNVNDRKMSYSVLELQNAN